MDGFKAEKNSIGKLLEGAKFFRVPDYQRPFSWDSDNFVDLIDDLIAANHDSEYFLGTIVLHSNNSSFDIVDGQQRLTSLILLFACLRDVIESSNRKASLHLKIVQTENLVDEIPERVRLEVRDAPLFNTYSSVIGSTNQLAGGENYNDSELKFGEAIGIFRARLLKLSQPQLDELSTFISTKCVLISLSTSNFADAFRLFSIVNDRGKQLRRIDILKAQNLAPQYLSSATERDSYANKWHGYENSLGADLFEDIFYTIRLIYLKEKPQGDLLKEFDERIFPHKVARGKQFLEESFRLINLYQRIFIDRDILEENDEKISNKYKNLMYIMLSEFKASEWKACILLFVSKFDTDNLFQFIYRLEKIYVGLWFAGVRKDERYAKYAAVLNLIEGSGTSSNVIEGMTFDNKAISKGISNQNIYGSGYAKYVLLRLELLASEHDQVREIQAKSIEHVLPQRPEPDSIWLTSHKQDELPQYVNSIGNLVLISKSKNSSASNREFKQKKETYLRNRVSDYPRSIAVLAVDDWTRSTIESRSKQAADDFLKDL